MKLLLASLLASAAAIAAELPNPAILVDQTAAQAQAQSVAARYATADIPEQQAAVEPTREDQYRRIQEDMQKWFPSSGGTARKNRRSEAKFHTVSSSECR